MMKIESQKDFEKLKKDGIYQCDEDLAIECSLCFIGSLHVKGSLFIKAGGICTWREISDAEKTITCGKHEGGVVGYGILKEIGLVK